MSISTIFTNVAKQAKSSSPELLAALGVTGVITTSYLSAKAAVHVAIDEDADPHASNKEKIQRYWKVYLPAGISGALTVGCIVGSNHASGRRTAAAVTAFSITERAFSEYKEKVVEQLGKGPEQKVRDRLAQEKVSENPPSNEVVFVGRGHVLFREQYTGRYFRLDMEMIKRAENEINERIYSDLYVMLSEFYTLLGIPHTSQSDYVGWDSNKPLKLEFYAVMTEGPEPEACMAFEYNYVKPL